MSTTPSTTTTPCYDKVKNCDEYKQDMCTSYKPWAQAHCNQYCGFCQGNIRQSVKYHNDAVITGKVIKKVL